MGWTASLFSQLHLIKMGGQAASSIYNHSLKLGYDYQSNADAVALIEVHLGIFAELNIIYIYIYIFALLKIH